MYTVHENIILFTRLLMKITHIASSLNRPQKKSTTCTHSDKGLRAVHSLGSCLLTFSWAGYVSHTLHVKIYSLTPWQMHKHHLLIDSELHVHVLVPTSSYVRDTVLYQAITRTCTRIFNVTGLENVPVFANMYGRSMDVIVHVHVDM